MPLFGDPMTQILNGKVMQKRNNCFYSVFFNFYSIIQSLDLNFNQMKD